MPNLLPNKEKHPMHTTKIDLTVPEFGQALTQVTSEDTLNLLLRRRSAPALTLGAPAPSEDDMAIILQIALRAPDHGKLNPWRIIRFSPESKARLIEALRPVAETQNDAKKAVATLQKLSVPPEMVVVVSSPVAHPKVTLWEQQLSAGAVCQNILIATIALGFNANWITEWMAYDAQAKALLGVTQTEAVAGIIMLGTALETPLERERAKVDDKISWWSA
jgi:nitroreductase